MCNVYYVYFLKDIQSVPRNLTVDEENNKNIIWESCYSKIEFKVKYIQAKDFLTE